MRLSRTLVAAVAAVALTAAAGCSQDPAQELSPATSTPTPTPTPSQGEFEKPTKPTPKPTQSPSAVVPPDGFSLEDIVPDMTSMGGFLGTRGTVRVGHHTGFDRVVWEFPGRGRPSYGVHYVDEPLAEGSGERVDLRGDSYIQVDVSRMGIPAAAGPRPTDAPEASLAGTVVADARAIGGGFEGYGQAWIGVRGDERPFRVIVLTNPSRLVVDIYSG